MRYLNTPTYPCNVWLRSDQITKSDHSWWSVQHSLVHVYIQDLGSHFHLGLSDAKSLLQNNIEANKHINFTFLALYCHQWISHVIIVFFLPSYLVVSRHDEFGKLPRSSHVTAFTNVDKISVWTYPKWL